MLDLQILNFVTCPSPVRASYDGQFSVQKHLEGLSKEFLEWSPPDILVSFILTKI